MTLDEALVKFEDYLTGQKHPALTITTYVKNVKYFREYLRENSVSTSVSELCREDVTEYLISLAKTGVGRSSASAANNTGGLSATTLKKVGSYPEIFHVSSGISLPQGGYYRGHKKSPYFQTGTGIFKSGKIQTIIV